MRTTIEKVLFLQRVPLLRDVPTDALAHIASIAHVEHLETGAELWQDGDPADDVYFVVDGAIGLTGDTVVGEGCDVGASALLGPDMVRDTDALALEPTTVLRLARDEFFDVLAEHPEVARAILEVLGVRLRGEEHRLDAGPYGERTPHAP